MSLFAVLRFLFVWVLALAIALVSYRFVLGVGTWMEPMLHHWLDRPWAFIAHVGFAPVALALVPFQFWSRLRARRPGLHRWLGRTYALAILIAGLGGIALAMTTDAGPVAGTGFGLLAVLWLGVTGQAVRLAMAGRIAEHRNWMIRSAALTMAAITLRLYLPLPAMTLGFDTGYLIVAWACWVPNALVAEWIVRRGRAPVPAIA